MAEQQRLERALIRAADVAQAARVLVSEILRRRHSRLCARQRTGGDVAIQALHRQRGDAVFRIRDLILDGELGARTHQLVLLVELRRRFLEIDVDEVRAALQVQRPGNAVRRLLIRPTVVQQSERLLPTPQIDPPLLVIAGWE